MKRLKFLFGAAALFAVALTASPALNAQENGNRDMDGKIVRGPYETNRFGDNWFIGVGGGINIFLNEGYDIRIGPSIDANFGKWFTPSVGMRVGYQGFQSKVWSETASLFGTMMDADKDMYPQKFGYMYIHGDFLWNMSDALSGYKETRFWNLIPYIHTGFYRSYGIDGVDFSDNEFAMGAGLLHNLRLTDRLDLIIDMRATVVNGRIHDASGMALLGTVTAGLAVDLGWPSFMRTATVLGVTELANVEKMAILETAVVALEAANEALESQNVKLAANNKNLNAEISSLKKQAKTEIDVAQYFAGITPTVYFEIGKSVLSPLELKHLEFIAEALIDKVDDDVQIVITVMGTADSNTGTPKRNKNLSEARGKYVYDILTQKYGINPDRLEVQSDVLDAAADPMFDRAVVISF